MHQVRSPRMTLMMTIQTCVMMSSRRRSIRSASAPANNEKIQMGSVEAVVTSATKKGPLCRPAVSRAISHGLAATSRAAVAT